MAALSVIVDQKKVASENLIPSCQSWLALTKIYSIEGDRKLEPDNTHGAFYFMQLKIIIRSSFGHSSHLPNYRKFINEKSIESVLKINVACVNKTYFGVPRVSEIFHYV